MTIRRHVSLVLALSLPSPSLAQDAPRLIKDVLAGAKHSLPRFVTTDLGYTYFAARNQAGDYDAIWKVVQGGRDAVLISNFKTPKKYKVNIQNLVGTGRRVYFSAFQDGTGRELYVIEDDKVKLIDLIKGEWGSKPNYIVRGEGREEIFFVAEERVGSGNKTGKQIFGASGTKVVRHLDCHGKGWHVPRIIALNNDYLYFSAFILNTVKQKSEGRVCYLHTWIPASGPIKNLPVGAHSPRFVGGYLDFLHNPSATSPNEIWCVFETGAYRIARPFANWKGPVPQLFDWTGGLDPLFLMRRSGQPTTLFALDAKNNMVDVPNSPVARAPLVPLYDPVRGESFIAFAGAEPATPRNLELWRATSRGAQIVKDIFPGTHVGSSPRNLLSIGSRVAFTADTVNGSRTDTELVVSDGTKAGTRVIDMVKGASSFADPKLVDVRGRIFAQVKETKTGIEPWSVVPGASSRWGTLGCGLPARLDFTSPVLGGQVTAAVRGIPKSVGMILVGRRLAKPVTTPPFSTACRLMVDPTGAFFLPFTLDAAGLWRTKINLPNDKNLKELFLSSQAGLTPPKMTRIDLSNEVLLTLRDWL